MSSSDEARKARQVSPAGYIWVTRFALILLCVIVVSGAAVRLTGSGLGCSDWPRCNSEKFIDVSTTHGAIEQINRLFTGLVTVIVIAAVLAARFRVPYRKDLVMLSWGLVAGVIGQIVLGGIVVLTDLHPLANQGHFILSMVLVANALILHQRAKTDRKLDRLSTLSGLQKLVRLTVVMGSVALVTGTVVTGSGPHAGDEKARRFDVAIITVARIHGISVLVAIALLLIVAWKMKQQRAQQLFGPLEMVLVIAILQATVGYVQYFNDIPALLVGIHIFGATMFFLSLVNLWMVSNQIADANPEMTERNSAIVS
ncbi:MAG: COX15/CtaA family protein [Ilumatobacteraceae bacterium]|jgi:heme a synthase|nr:COX15/CtaA family protein [Ilumatobacteraceae bacterium]MDP4712721.1 COX15/CtaA family protein [Ilumatobacteraceae bacterium]MDP4937073.1 COX15/CtaA family protein [Ilumatobacteraceae bacterium]MDP4977484.1 COX15/CtaA family protein [Ilumatobacteraceae bacterium]MDP5115151.1 COX15/CtaA family protein [Ilumatobacteraceae bacterium]